MKIKGKKSDDDGKTARTINKLSESCLELPCARRRVACEDCSLVKRSKKLYGYRAF